MATNTTDRAFKILTNRRVTDENKAYYEEVGAETLTVTADQLWAQTVPENDPATGISNSIVEFRSQLALTEDVTVGSQESWYAADGDGYRLLDWISDRFGNDYTARLYDNNGSQIFPTDTLDWFFDYPTGILTISGDASAFAQPFLLDGYRYIGTKGIVNAYQTVADLAARDAISSSQRVEGMLVYVIADGQSYRLGAGLTNGDWAIEVTGGSGSGSGSGTILVPNQAGRDASGALDGYQVYQQDFDILWLYEDGEWQMQSIQPQYYPEIVSPASSDGYGLIFWLDATGGDDNNDGLDVTRPRQTILSLIKDFNRIRFVNGFVRVMFAPGSYDTEFLPNVKLWCQYGLFFQARVSEFASNEYVTIPGGTGALADGYVAIWETTTSGFTSFGNHEKCFWRSDNLSASGDLLAGGDAALVESTSPVLRRVSSGAPTWTDGYIADFEVIFTGGHLFGSDGSVIQARHIFIDLDFTNDILSTGGNMIGWACTYCKLRSSGAVPRGLTMGSSIADQTYMVDANEFGLGDLLIGSVPPGVYNSSFSIAPTGALFTLRVDMDAAPSYTSFGMSGHIEGINVENGKINIGTMYAHNNTYFELNHTLQAGGSTISISGSVDINNQRTTQTFIHLEGIASGRSLGNINLINCETFVQATNNSVFRLQRQGSTGVSGTTTGPVFIAEEGGRLTGLERSTATNSTTPGNDIQVGGTRDTIPGYLSNAELASNGFASHDDGAAVHYSDDNF